MVSTVHGTGTGLTGIISGQKWAIISVAIMFAGSLSGGTAMAYIQAGMYSTHCNSTDTGSSHTWE